MHNNAPPSCSHPRLVLRVSCALRLPSCRQRAQLKNLNGSDVEDLPGGEGADGLRDAVKSEKAERRAEGSGGVWLRAFDDVPPLAPSKKLVSRNGKLELETELGPPPPNGTSVTLCGSSSCGALLAETHAYAGRVVSGGDLVEEIAALPTVRVNRKLKYGSNVADIIAPRENRTFKKVTMKAGLL